MKSLERKWRIIRLALQVGRATFALLVRVPTEAVLVDLGLVVSHKVEQISIMVCASQRVKTKTSFLIKKKVHTTHYTLQYTHKVMAHTGEECRTVHSTNTHIGQCAPKVDVILVEVK